MKIIDNDDDDFGNKEIDDIGDDDIGVENNDNEFNRRIFHRLIWRIVDCFAFGRFFQAVSKYEVD